MISLLAAILLDMKIILIAGQRSHMALIIEALIILIHPFTCSSIIIPCVNEETLDFIDAPVPFIIGMGMNDFR